MSRKRVGVVGGGLGGLAAACTLAARGHEVVLFEANEWLGGKAAVLEEGGYRFDMGPTILTLPMTLRRIFREAGRHLDDAIELVRLDPQWRCFFSDGSELDLVEEPGAMARRLDEFSPGVGAGQGYREFLDRAKRLHHISDAFFFWRPIGSIRDMGRASDRVSLGMVRSVLDLQMGRTVSSLVRRYQPDRRAAQMLDHFTQYVGSAPDQSPAVLCGIASMQVGGGVWYPMGGTRAVPEALEGLAKDLGVELRTGCAVGRIRTDGGCVTGIETEAGERLDFDAVVSNMDSVRTHRELIGGRPAERFLRRRKYEPACSGVVLYLGLRRSYEHLLHHGFVFSRDPEAEFESIYRRGEPAADPTCYLAAPARTDPGVAPEGGDALYVLTHTPYVRPGQDWGKMLPGYRQVILDKLKTTGKMPDLEDRIEVESVLTPADIGRWYRVLDGAIYGLASHGRFLGAFKPRNDSRDVRGLYLAGGSAHPGPGMPLVLMSGWIAADVLDREAGGGQGGRR
ncbi:MAG: phytoene desaturase family protein [Phycisphaeraceae bacterium]